ncbi:MAG: glycerol-3-phosphate 1-O-acyltransferase PlsY [Candidatus Sumerlaeaceae bacterium]
MLTLLAMVIAYFIGSIPTGLWIGRQVLGLDIREHGSGNMGATNAFRVLGKKWGATVLFLDVLKGLGPVVVLPLLLGIKSDSLIELLIGGSAIAGHVFSCFVNFRGGKGVATALGVFLAVAMWQMLTVLAIGIAIIVITGYVSAAAVTGALVLPVLLYFSNKSALVLLVSCIVSVMVIVRHKSNIQRLFIGRENRLHDPVDVGPEDYRIPPATSPRTFSDEK